MSTVLKFVVGLSTFVLALGAGFAASAPDAEAQLLEPPVCEEPGFVDVPPDEYYVEAVSWAACHGITQGTSDTTFSPNDPVTRGQLATFLWRFANRPDVGPHPFVDVAPAEYFNDPVGWMASNDITQGTSDTTFSPLAPVSRAQMATFLWRFVQEPAVAPADEFVDVPATEYFAVPVGWLASTGITQGTSDTTFSPGITLSRADAVTFLWRLANTPSETKLPGWPVDGEIELLTTGLRTFTVGWSDPLIGLEQADTLELTVRRNGLTDETFTVDPSVAGTVFFEDLSGDDFQSGEMIELILVGENEAGIGSELTATMQTPEFVVENTSTSTFVLPGDLAAGSFSAAASAPPALQVAQLAAPSCVVLPGSLYLGLTRHGLILFDDVTRYYGSFSVDFEVCTDGPEITSVDWGNGSNDQANAACESLVDSGVDGRSGEGTRNVMAMVGSPQILSQTPTQVVVEFNCTFVGEADLALRGDPDYDTFGRTFTFQTEITLENDMLLIYVEWEAEKFDYVIV